ncbi:MAG: UvrB/UvrC motif-containing protein, partial [Melioribacteraceae bacterium]|nr:UvrB/UvrC motif-containing protein [Melioribacteraceae bacterium]
VRTGAPIFVSEDVMNTAAFIPTSEGDEAELDDFLEESTEQKKPKSSTKETKSASLQDQLREALEKEDYERAAKLRDEINKLKGTNN